MYRDCFKAWPQAFFRPDNHPKPFILSADEARKDVADTYIKGNIAALRSEHLAAQQAAQCAAEAAEAQSHAVSAEIAELRSHAADAVTNAAEARRQAAAAEAEQAALLEKLEVQSAALADAEKRRSEAAQVRGFGVRV